MLFNVFFQARVNMIVAAEDRDGARRSVEKWLQAQKYVSVSPDLCYTLTGQSTPEISVTGGRMFAERTPAPSPVVAITSLDELIEAEEQLGAILNKAGPQLTDH